MLLLVDVGFDMCFTTVYKWKSFYDYVERVTHRRRKKSPLESTNEWREPFSLDVRVYDIR